MSCGFVRSFGECVSASPSHQMKRTVLAAVLLNLILLLILLDSLYILSPSLTHTHTHTH